MGEFSYKLFFYYLITFSCKYFEQNAQTCKRKQLPLGLKINMKYQRKCYPYMCGINKLRLSGEIKHTKKLFISWVEWRGKIGYQKKIQKLM